VHIPDGWIDLPTSGAAAVVAVAGTAAAARKAKVVVTERVTTLPAVIAAYLLVAQLLVFPVGLGTSAHLIGTGLAALLVGPAVAIVCVAVVVVVQALLLADGGVTAIGLNIINDGIVPALVAWAAFRVLLPLVSKRRAGPGRIRESGGPPPGSESSPACPAGTAVRVAPRSAKTLGTRRVAVIAGLAAGAASLAAGAAVATEFVIGGTDAVPAGAVAASIGGSHVLLALAEGILTGLVVAALLRLRPDLIRACRAAPPSSDRAAA
jgi:cobalt/nickel transport system permease protein